MTEIKNLIVGCVYSFQTFKWFNQPFQNSEERHLKKIQNLNDSTLSVKKAIFLGTSDIIWEEDRYVCFWTKWLDFETNKIIYVATDEKNYVVNFVKL